MTHLLISCAIFSIAGLLAGLTIGSRRSRTAPAGSVETTRRDDELMTAISRAEKADRAKSEILANTSHDIRTPLTAILGYTELLQDELPVGARTRQWADVMHRNGRHLLGLLDDILDLSKIEARKMTVEAVACSPKQLLDEVRSLLSVRADEKGLKFTVEYAGPIPETIKTDPTRVRQILINLVANAVKFTEVGGVTVRCRLDTGAMDPRLRVDIIDTGLGMTPAQQQRVFDPFTQADESHARRFGGSGLGLTISKQLALMLGGDVSVQSVAGKGSTFTLTIKIGPLGGVALIDPAGAASEPTPTPIPTSTSTTDGMLQGGRILLADDGVDNRRMLELLLARAGAVVTSVDDGAQAIRVLTGGAEFDVLLFDMEMPTLDGYAAARQLRHGGYAGPIVALTANAMCGEREKCLAAGCNDYATKPINRRALLATLAKWMPAARNDHPFETPSDTCREDSPVQHVEIPNVAA